MDRRSPPQPPRVTEHIARMTPYQPGKPIAEVRRELGLTDIVKLASNENPLGPPPRAVEAMGKALWSAHQYPEGSCHELRAELSRHLRVAEDNLAFGNGSDELIHLLGLAFLGPGDEVIQGDPTFTRYESAATLAQAVCIRVPLREWRYDVEAMIASMTPRTRLVFVANPNNPTGAFMTQKEADLLVSSAPDRCVVCFDEAYFEFVEADDFPDALKYVRHTENVVILRTFSKAYGLAGLRIGYAVSRPEVIHGVEQVREPFNVNSLAQVGALAALADSDHLRRSRHLVSVGKRTLAEGLARLGLTVYPSEGNFVWVDTHRDSRKLFDALLRKGVIVRTGDIFGAPSYLRITIGTSDENERLLGALEDTLTS